MRILRHLPYIGLASLLFISCGKKQKSETTEQNKEAAKVEVPLQPTDQAVAFIKLQAEEGIRDAKYKYAYHLATGLGVSKDYVKASGNKAAAQGHRGSVSSCAASLSGLEDGAFKTCRVLSGF